MSPLSRLLGGKQVGHELPGWWRNALLLAGCVLSWTWAGMGADSNAPPVASPGGPATPVLTNVAQILALSPDRARLGLPVAVRGLVTYYEPGMLFFVQDETGGVFVYHPGELASLQAGQLVAITGLAQPGRFSPIIDEPKVTGVQSSEIEAGIKPRRATLAQVYLGTLDAQWVEVCGVVQAREISEGRVRFELVESPHRINVWLRHSHRHRELPGPGSVVSVRGVVGGHVNDSGDVDEFQIFASAPADFAVLRPAPADPRAGPVRQVRDLVLHAVRTEGQVRVRGVVTLHWSGRGLFVQDASGAIEVRPQGPLRPLAPGTEVDAVGFLGPILESPRLDNALVSILCTNPPPPPTRLSPQDFLRKHQIGELVEIEGRLLGMVDAPSNGVGLALQAGHYLVNARLDPCLPASAWARFEPGSQLRLTGVFQTRQGFGAEPLAELLLRSVEDVQVMSLPPVSRRGFEPRALAWVALVASAVLLAVLGFLVRQRRRIESALRFQAELQTQMRESERQLRCSLEERERIGRDLHDDIIQSIYAVGLSLEDCRRVVRQSPVRADERLAGAIQTLNNTIRSVRGFIAGLEPRVVNGREFKTALKSMALVSGDGPAQFHLEIDTAGANSLTSTQATQLLHIAKEAMSNSLRHAHAANILVSLHPVGGGVCLEIRDDGAGFDPALVSGAGQGLRNMSARAREIGAELQLISKPRQGCRILVTVPQRNSNEPERD